ncbi:MAG TPA: TonB-dependent receptor [Gemmatimonadales bacterium]
MSTRVAATLAWLALAAAPLRAQVPDTLRPPVEVAPIVVTTARVPEPAERLPAAVTILEGNEIPQPGPLEGLDGLLGAVPGVFVANRYNFSLDQRLSIRGFGSRANFGSRGVRVLLDGVPQTLPDGQTQFSNVETADVTRVEVLRGAASALHGNASGGVISLRTAPADGAPLSGLASLEAGSFGTLKWHARTGGRSGAWSGSASVSRLTTDGFRAHSAADQRQVSGALDWQLSGRTSAGIRVSAADHPVADNPGALTAEEVAADPAAAAPNNVAREAGKSVEQQQASLQLRHRIADGEIAAVLYGIWRDLDNPLATGVRVGLDRAVAGARLDASRRVGRAGPRLAGGVDLQVMRDDRTNRSSDTGELLVDQRDRVSEVGPFLQAVWAPVGPVLLEAGARYDRTVFEVTDHSMADGDDGGRRTLDAWSARGGASVELGPAVRLYASLSTAFETPTTTELGNRPDGSGGLNPELGPQRAIAWEVGGRGGSGPLEWSVALYTSSIRDAIVQSEEIGGRAFFRNAGRVRQQGAEGALAFRPAMPLVVSVAYTLADHRFTDYEAEGVTLDGRRVPGIPVHHLRARAGYEHGPWSAAVEHALSSRLWADDENSIEVAGWGAGVTDVSLRWTAHVRDLELAPFVAVQNVTGRSYIGSVTINGFNGRVFEPAPGRHAVLGVSARYSTGR